MPRQGRVENVIVAVYTTYATDRGHALIDRDLYVQADWFEDPEWMFQCRLRRSSEGTRDSPRPAPGSGPGGPAARTTGVHRSAGRARPGG